MNTHARAPHGPLICTLGATALLAAGGFQPEDFEREIAVFPGLGPLVTARAETKLLDGNGFATVDDTVSSDAYVLAPGVRYLALVGVVNEVDAADLAEDGPESVFTLEAGGVSDFDGISVSLDPRVVPAPSSLALFGIAPLALFRRRRGLHPS